MSTDIITGPDPRAGVAVRLGTRGSALARTQSLQVAAALEAAAAGLGRALHVELVEVRTRGDDDPTPLSRLGGAGVFAAALRRALLEGHCDLAVHSCKDLPTAPVPGLAIAAVPRREDPRDALCTQEAGDAGAAYDAGDLWDTGPGPRDAGDARHARDTREAGGFGDDASRAVRLLGALPHGARVGTGSPRRAAQLLALRPDLEIVDIRGNVPTRLARVLGRAVGADGAMGAVEEPDLDAVVLAMAGLTRLGLRERASAVLPGSLMLPAPAQGALAVETRDDVGARMPVLAAALEALDDPLTRAAVEAERSLMRVLGAGCAAPVGALAAPARADAEPACGQGAGPQGSPPPGLAMDAVVVSPDGRSRVRVGASAPAHLAEELGADLARRLLEAGAGEITELGAVKAHVPPEHRP